MYGLRLSLQSNLGSDSKLSGLAPVIEDKDVSQNFFYIVVTE